MKIDINTKISTIIKHNEKAIDVIASINPHFNKLKNPILRRVLAPRVTIADAAKIGKCSVNDFFEKLQEIGFEIDNVSELETNEQLTPTPSHLSDFIGNYSIVEFDVRPILDSGSDPLQEILKKVKVIKQNEILKIINSFKPIPLITLLKNKGYDSYDLVEKDEFHVYFKKNENASPIPKNTENLIFHVEKNEFETLKNNIKFTEIDVRELEMPMPMITILDELEKIPPNNGLFVHHKKIPQYLLPELENRNVKTYIYSIDSTNVKLLIIK